MLCADAISMPPRGLQRATRDHHGHAAAPWRRRPRPTTNTETASTTAFPHARPQHWRRSFRRCRGSSRRRTLSRPTRRSWSPPILGDGRGADRRGDERAERGREECSGPRRARRRRGRRPTQRRPGAGLHGRDIPPAAAVRQRPAASAQRKSPRNPASRRRGGREHPRSIHSAAGSLPCRKALADRLFTAADSAARCRVHEAS